MRQIVRETAHSLRRGWFGNLLLMVQLTLLLWSCMLVLTHRLDIPIDADAPQTDLNFLYREATDLDARKRDDYLMNQMNMTTGYVHNVQRAVAALRQSGAFTYLQCVESAVSVRAEQLYERFAPEELTPYLANPYQVNALFQQVWKTMNAQPGLTPQMLEKIAAPHDNFHLGSAIGLSAVSVDEAAVRCFGLRAAQGRLFAEEDYLLRAPDRRVPVVLGSAYQGRYALGEQFTLYYEWANKVLEVEVIGFLQPGCTVSFLAYPPRPDTVSQVLDATVVLPVLEPVFAPKNEDEGLWLQTGVTSTFSVGSAVLLPPGASRAQLTAAQREIKDTLLQNSLPSLLLGTPSYGTLYFQNESETTVLLLLRLVLFAIVVCSVCTVLFLLARTKRSMRRYGILRMNGCSLGALAASAMLEILVLFLVPACVAGGLFYAQLRANPAFLLLLLAIALGLAGIACACVLWRLRGAQLEYFVRGLGND